MFERYTEKARRVIFFARYEASTYGSTEIDTEHLLLGLLREDKSLCRRWLSRANVETMRRRIDECSPKLPSIPTNIDLPLSSAARRILKHAADEADLLAHKHIGTEHLFLGLLDEEDCFAAQLLREGGADAATVRSQLADVVREQERSSDFQSIPGREQKSAFAAPIEIHRVRRNAQQVREAVQHCRMHNWRWDKRSWIDVDIIKEKKTGKVSFDLRLAEDSENFELVKGGLKKDLCFICGWELFESQTDADHGTGYTNGRLWLCVECYSKFWEDPDFLSSRYSDIT
jgi:hypothetical protein